MSCAPPGTPFSAEPQLNTSLCPLWPVIFQGFVPNKHCLVIWRHPHAFICCPRAIPEECTTPGAVHPIFRGVEDAAPLQSVTSVISRFRDFHKNLATQGCADSKGSTRHTLNSLFFFFLSILIYCNTTGHKQLCKGFINLLAHSRYFKSSLTQLLDVLAHC